jgi:hypothetical protein
MDLAIFIMDGNPDRFNTVQLRSEEPLPPAAKNSGKFCRWPACWVRGSAGRLPAPAGRLIAGWIGLAWLESNTEPVLVAIK